jgi:hypothetical protein
MMQNKTNSGNHIIFNIHDLAKGLDQKIPDDFDLSNGDWFFQPSSWTKENHFGRLENYARALKNRAKFPPTYSFGYKDADEAFLQAELYEQESKKDQKQNEAFESWMKEW